MQKITDKRFTRVIVSFFTFSLLALSFSFGNVCDSDIYATSDVYPTVKTMSAALKPGDTIYFGRYPQTEIGMLKPTTGKEGVDYVIQRKQIIADDPSPGSIFYFQIEPIAWRVLEVSNGAIFLMSEKNLDCHYFNSGHNGYRGGVKASWSRSSIRSWLNGYSDKENIGGDTGEGIDYTKDNFIDKAFSGKEASSILVSSIEATFDDESTDPNGQSVKDKIFLMSLNDLINPAFGFDSDKDAQNPARRSINSQYAFAKGSGHGDPNRIEYAPYWLRTHADIDSVDASGVNANGQHRPFRSSGSSSGSSDRRGTKPALRLDSTSQNYKLVSIGTAGEYKTVFSSAITFHANGGKIGTSTSKKILTDTHAVPGKAPLAKKKGHTFKGFYTDKKTGEIAFDKSRNVIADLSGHTNNKKNWIAANDTTLYAQWKINKYKVTFNASGGKINGNKKYTKKLKYNTKLKKMPIPKKKGKKFAGWYTKKNGGKKITKNTKVPAKNVTYYAHWKQIPTK